MRRSMCSQTIRDFFVAARIKLGRDAKSKHCDVDAFHAHFEPVAAASRKFEGAQCDGDKNEQTSQQMQLVRSQMLRWCAQ